MSAGRKRSFDKEVALDKAMRVFWDNGYSGTSLSDLTHELNINKPSLYSAFGNKEQLFEASLNYYVTQYGEPHLKFLCEPAEAPLKTRLNNYFHNVIEMLTNKDTPLGCFFVKSNCESGGETFSLQLSKQVKNILLKQEKTLTDIFAKELERGELMTQSPLKEVATYLLSITHGLSVQARAGISKKELIAVAEFALSTFPCKQHS